MLLSPRRRSSSPSTFLLHGGVEAVSCGTEAGVFSWANLCADSFLFFCVTGVPTYSPNPPQRLRQVDPVARVVRPPPPREMGRLQMPRRSLLSQRSLEEPHTSRHAPTLRHKSHQTIHGGATTERIKRQAKLMMSDTPRGIARLNIVGRIHDGLLRDQGNGFSERCKINHAPFGLSASPRVATMSFNPYQMTNL